MPLLKKESQNYVGTQRQFCFVDCSLCLFFFCLCLLACHAIHLLCFFSLFSSLVTRSFIIPPPILFNTHAHTHTHAHTRTHTHTHAHTHSLSFEPLCVCSAQHHRPSWKTKERSRPTQTRPKPLHPQMPWQRRLKKPARVTTSRWPR